MTVNVSGYINPVICPSMIRDAEICCLGAGGKTPFNTVFYLELTIHHQGVDVAMPWMPEGLGEATYDFESKFLPEMYGGLIGADDEIKLHGTKTEVAGEVERMGAHGAGNAASCGPGSGHIAAVRDMAASALLIGAQIVGA